MLNFSFFVAFQDQAASWVEGLQELGVMGRELVWLPFGAPFSCNRALPKKDTVVVVYALTTRSGNSRSILWATGSPDYFSRIHYSNRSR